MLLTFFDLDLGWVEKVGYIDYILANRSTWLSVEPLTAVILTNWLNFSTCFLLSVMRDKM